MRLIPPRIWSLSNKRIMTVLAVGVLPPPVSGLTLVTQRMIDVFCAESIARGVVPILGRTLSRNVHIVNLSSRHSVDSFAFKVCKAAKVIGAAIRILGMKVRGEQVTLYMPLNAGSGMFFNLTLSIVASACRVKQVLHHHSWAYFYSSNKLLMLISRLMRKTGTHVVLCEKMRDELRERYPDAKSIMVLSNSVFYPPSERLGSVGRGDSKVLRIGHLSNLTISKGLDDVIKTFSALVSRGVSAKLILAGSPHTSVEKELIDEAKNVFGSNIELQGAVYGNDKMEFYRGIDVFIFPTRYHNEAEPLVIWEALGHGVPVIARQRGCLTKSMIGDAGLCVESDEDFVSIAVEKLAMWYAQQEDLFAASVAARRQAARGYEIGETQLKKINDLVLGK